MSNDEKKLKMPTPHPDHPLKTRRDFLAQGFISMSGMYLAPTLYTLLTQKVEAQTSNIACPPKNLANAYVPLISIELAGGGIIAGRNVLVGDIGGQMDFINDYKSLGLNPSESPTTAAKVSSELGLKFHTDGGHYKGIMQVFGNNLAPLSGGKTNGFVMCTLSSDDTANNPFVPSHWIVKSGRMGALTSIVGTSASNSGTRSRTVNGSYIPAYHPVRINDVGAATGLASMDKNNSAYSSVMAMNESVAAKILKRIERLSESQLQAFSNQDISTQLKQSVNNNYFGSRCQMGGTFSSTELDASQDSVMTQVFPQIASNSDQARQASIIKLVMDGYAGTGNIELGGYDYHNQNSNSTNAPEAKDLEAGVLIGRILKVAQLKNMPVAIYVYSDGAVAFGNDPDPNTGRNLPTGDSGQRGASYMLVYHPTKIVPGRNTARQLGAFKDSGTVNTTISPISNSVQHMASAVFANYLAIHGFEGQYDNLVDLNLFPGSVLDSILFFNKIV
jgi:hypothetical protein